MVSIAPVLDWQAIGVAAAAAFALSLGFCLALVLTRDWHGRVTNDDATGVQKFHTVPTPRVGGLAVGLAYFLTWPVLPEALRPAWVMIGASGLPALGAGLAEDLTRRVTVRWRLAATMAAGVVFALLTGYTMDKVDLPGVDWLLSFYLVALAFTGFAMGGVANAINIIDGFNGLAAGALIIMLGAFSYVGFAAGDGLVVGLAVIFAALVAGFFVVNFPHGRIFLGDGGAYFCGFVLASLGVLLPARNAEVSAWCAVLICAYPVIETLASMRRKSRREGHSVGRPDRVHFHMLAHRHYARRMVKADGRKHLRNPATSVVTWAMPALTAIFAAIAWDNALLCAGLFFVTVFVYGLLYRVMSLNSPALRVARLL